MQFADRLQHVEVSAIRELFKLLGKPGIISFAGGFPDSALFDVAGIQAATNAVLEHEAGAALQYGVTEGFDPLREQIAQMMNAKMAAQATTQTATQAPTGLARIAPEHMLITTGSQQALDLIGKAMLNPGDKAIVEAPTFLTGIQSFRLYGVELIGAPIDEQGVCVDTLEQLIIEHRPKFIYLIPSFSNPSGTVLNLQRRKRVLELAVQYRVLVLEDDPYGDLYFDRPPPPSLLALTEQVAGSRDWLAHCGSLSKVLSPGLRLGWLIAPPQLLAHCVMCKQFGDAHTSTFAQAIAAQYLRSGRLPGQVQHMRSTYARRAHVMGQALREHLGDAVHFVQPQGGLFLWVRLTGKAGAVNDASEFARRALTQGVAFVPGTPFYVQSPDTATLRLSFATVAQETICEGIARLKQAL